MSGNYNNPAKEVIGTWRVYIDLHWSTILEHFFVAFALIITESTQILRNPN